MGLHWDRVASLVQEHRAGVCASCAAGVLALPPSEVTATLLALEAFPPYARAFAWCTMCREMADVTCRRS
jgi:hypothetical protein